MINKNTTSKIQTVLGPIDPEKLGVTLTHEHLLWDPTEGFSPPSEASMRDVYYKPLVTDHPGYPETLSLIRHATGNVNIDNCKLLSVSTAIDQVLLFKQFGGDSIVDTTSLGPARDPVGLARISRATGLNIIMGGSYYVGSSHPAEMDQITEDELFENIMRDLTEGADRTSIKPGIIGEIGCTWPMTDNECKVLLASGRAQKATGVPLHIHPGRDERAPFHILDMLDGVGADLSKVIMGHIERTFFEKNLLKQLAKRECYIEWDLFGNERSYYTASDLDVTRDLPNDSTRMDQIEWLASEGFGNKIVVSHDIAYKYQFTHHAGYSYHYILSHIVPRMRARGFDDELINNILINNPKDALSFG